MISIILGFFPRRRHPRKYVWRNKNHDIPVTFLQSAGSMNGVEYAQVEYENKVSFVPMSELYYD